MKAQPSVRVLFALFEATHTVRKRELSPDMLTVLPGNIFQEGLNSGQVTFGKPNEISLGAVKSGALEASNVDIAEELTNMIESQRNYTANSKVFQTGGDLMDVLVNLKR